MNGNYYAVKLLNQLYKRYILVPILGITIFLVNIYMSYPTLKIKNFRYSFENPLTMKKVSIFISGNEKWIPAFNIVYLILSCAASLIIAKWLYEMFVKRYFKRSLDEKEVHISEIKVPDFPFNKNEFQLIMGLEHNKDSLDEVNNPKWVVVPHKGMCQDFIVLGQKGSGKTQGEIYPFADQIINYYSDDSDKKAGILLLDVKGNLCSKIEDMARKCNREDDIVIIELLGKYRTNLMDKPYYESFVLAKIIRLIMEMFSSGKSSNEGYWLDTAETILDVSIKLARLRYGYFTFVELDKLSNSEDFLKNTITEIRDELECHGRVLTEEEMFELDYIENWYIYKYSEIKPETKVIFNTEIQRMLRPFVSNYKAVKTFCCPESENNFKGFSELIDNGKIVVLKMDYATYKELSKIVAAFLKLDFQTEVLLRLKNNKVSKRPVVFMCDEYHIFATSNDYEFYSLSREANCCNIVATQGLSSLLESLHSVDKVRLLFNNLGNKIFLQNTDKLTIEEAIYILGREEKIKERISLTEGTDSEGKYIAAIDQVASSKGTSYSKTINYDTYKDNIFSAEDFTTKLRNFTSICLLSDGDKIIYKGFLHNIPHFSKFYNNLNSRS